MSPRDRHGPRDPTGDRVSYETRRLGQGLSSNVTSPLISCTRPRPHFYRPTDPGVEEVRALLQSGYLEF